MYIHSENTKTGKLSELNHLSSSWKKNQPRFYEVVVSENRLVQNILKWINNRFKYNKI